MMKSITEKEAKSYNPLSLAFFGDAVYETLVRRKLLEDAAESGGGNAFALHNNAVKKVRASFQSETVQRILPMLTETETEIFKRGRNTKSSVPRSATTSDYRRATGLEAVFGFLALCGNFGRIEELFEIGVVNEQNID
jgi:ribonuclease-3 family protein